MVRLPFAFHGSPARLAQALAVPPSELRGRSGNYRRNRPWCGFRSPSMAHRPGSRAKPLKASRKRPPCHHLSYEATAAIV